MVCLWWLFFIFMKSLIFLPRCLNCSNMWWDMFVISQFNSAVDVRLVEGAIHIVPFCYLFEIIMNSTPVLFLICGQRVVGQMEGRRPVCEFVLLKSPGAPGDHFLDRSEQRKAKPLDTLMARPSTVDLRWLQMGLTDWKLVEEDLLRDELCVFLQEL